MTTEKVTAHYTHGSLMETILGKLAEARVPLDTLTVYDLASMDHLHGRGREATDEMIARLSPAAGQHVVDIGCGGRQPVTSQAPSCYGRFATMGWLWARSRTQVSTLRHRLR